jgi:hypothetical protein
MITRKRKENNLKKERKCVGFPCMKPMFLAWKTYVLHLGNIKNNERMAIYFFDLLK